MPLAGSTCLRYTCIVSLFYTHHKDIVMRRLDLSGEKYGRLTVVAFIGIANTKSVFRCRCDCGKELTLKGNALRSGNTTSCGCYRTEKLNSPKTSTPHICPVCHKSFLLSQYRRKKHNASCCSRDCAIVFSRMSGAFALTNNAAWKGGRHLHPRGYVLVRHNKHYILEHRLVMEQHLGRPLLSTEHVHHKNHDKTDNRIENLQLTNASEHRQFHPLTTWGKHGFTSCTACGGTESRHITNGLCSKCYDKRRYRLKGRRNRK